MSKLNEHESDHNKLSDNNKISMMYDYQPGFMSAVINEEGLILSADDNYRQLFELSDQSVEYHFSDVSSEILQKQLKSLLTQCQIQGHSEDEIQIRLQNGEFIKCHIHLHQQIYRDKGTVFLCLIQAQELSCSQFAPGKEEGFRLLTNNLPVAITYIDNELQIVFHNQQETQKFYIDITLSPKPRLDNVIPLHVYQKIEPHIKSALKGEHVRFEYELQPDKGESYVYNVQYIPVSQSGETRGFYILSEEISQQKLTLERLRATDRELRIHSEVTQTLSRLDKMDDVTVEICRIIVGNADYEGAAIFEVPGDDQSHHVLACEFKDTSSKDVFKSFIDSLFNSQSMQKSLEQKDVFIQKHPQSNSVFLFFNVANIDNKVYFLCAQSQHYIAENESETRLLSHLSNNLGFALKNLHAQDKIRRTEELLNRNNQLLESIQKTQSTFIDNENSLNFYSEIMQTVIDLTSSEFGFIAELQYDSVLTSRIERMNVQTFYNDRILENLNASIESRKCDIDVDRFCRDLIHTEDSCTLNLPLLQTLFKGYIENIPEIRNCHCLPVMHENEVIALIVYVNANPLNNVSPKAELLQLVQTLANLIIANRNAIGRETAEKILEYENRAYEIIASNRSEDDILSDICLLLEDAIDGARAVTMKVDKTNRILTNPVGPGMPKEFLQEMQSIPVSTESACCGRAAFFSEPVHISDIPNSSLWSAYHNISNEHQLISCWSTPVCNSAAEVVLTVDLYFSESRKANDYESKILQRLAPIVGLSVEKFEADNRVLESEHKFRLSFEASPVAKMMVDQQGNVKEINDAFIELIGYNGIELLDMNLSDLVRPDDVKICRDIIVSLADNEFDNFDFEADFISKKQQSLSVLINASALRKEGEFIYGFLQIQDVTDKKRAVEREIRLGRILEESLSEIYVFDNKSYHFQLVNRGGRENLGFEMHELLKRTPTDIIADIDHTKFLRLLEPLSKGQSEDIQLNLSFRRKGGSLYDAEVNIQLFHLDGASQYVMMAKDITQNKVLSEKLRYHASHDSLTGLVNRREFENRLKRVIRSAQRNTVEHALCYLDLDQFKIVNDTCGHMAGDELLRQISRILNKYIRNRDTIARLGGDEFGILMEHCSLEQAIRISNDIRMAVEEYRYVWQGKKFVLGISIGLTAIDQTTQTMNQALSEADAACYAAKDAGRNRVHVYTPDDKEVSRLRGEIQWVNRINDAIDANDFVLYMQKIVSISEFNDAGNDFVEILIRMNEDDGRVAQPGAFMPAAERFQLATRIDRWVFQNVIEFFQQRQDRLESLGMCSINISGQTVSDDDFRQWATDLIKTEKFPAEKLCFEITETAAIANMTNALGFISEFKELGCRFALDDFGSGLSSFAYLKNLPVDFIKIDGTFVRDILNDPVDYEMVHAIHDLGKIMGKLMIAEFVEKDEIEERLKEIGVDFAQGFALHKPQPLI